MIKSFYNFREARFSFYNDQTLIESFDSSYWNDFRSEKLEIKALLDAGIAKATEQKNIMIGISDIYKSLAKKDENVFEEEFSNLLSPNLLDFLEIPNIADGIFKIESKFTSASPKFQIMLEYFPNKLPEQSIRISDSPKFPMAETSYLLPELGCQLCGEVLAHREKNNDSKSNNLLIGKLKRFEKLSMASFVGGQIKTEEVEYVEQIKPDITTVNEEGDFEIGFDLESGNGQQLEDLVLKGHDGQNTYTENLGGRNRKRFVLSESARKAVKTYRQKRKFKSTDRRQLIENPEEVLDGFDLTDYGDRVIGKGILYAPVIRHLKDKDGKEWISIDLQELEPSVGSNEGQNKKPKEPFPFSEDEAEEVLELILQAKENGKDTFNWKGMEIVITQELVKQLERLIKKEGDLKLITKSNIDEVKYSKGKTETISVPESFPYQKPKSFSDQITLYPYQKNGFGWIKWVLNNEYSGCLLADEMGLGKTIQICAFLAHLKDNNTLGTTLIIMPPILFKNWTSEIENLVPDLSIYTYHGSKRKIALKELQDYDLVFATYETLLRNQIELGKINFDLIVSDESQAIKNLVPYFYFSFV